MTTVSSWLTKSKLNIYRTCNKLQTSPGPNQKSRFKVTKVWQPVGYRKTHYYINTSEIPSEPWRENLISSHVKTSNVKRSPLLMLHYKSRLFHWCLCNKRNITCPLVDKNFISPCLTRYLKSERSERVRYWVEHLKIKLISTHGHVIYYCNFKVSTRVVESKSHFSKLIYYLRNRLTPILHPIRGRNRTKLVTRFSRAARQVMCVCLEFLLVH